MEDIECPVDDVKSEEESFEEEKENNPAAEFNVIRLSQQLEQTEKTASQQLKETNENARDRRTKMLEAYNGNEEGLTPDKSMFQPSKEDQEWLKNKWQPWVDCLTRKNAVLQDQQDISVVHAKANHQDVPKVYRRQVARTVDNYTYGLKLVATMYQKFGQEKYGKEYVLKLKDFLAFDSPDTLVQIKDPRIYLNVTWTWGTLPMKKMFISTHNNLIMFVKDEARGQYGGFQHQQYVNWILSIHQDCLSAKLGTNIQTRILEQRKKNEEDRGKFWAKSMGVGDENSLAEDIGKYFESQYVKEANHLVFAQAKQQNPEKLSAIDFAKGTRTVVMQLQITHGGRTERADMTMNEWWGREKEEKIEEYIVKITRYWTKQSGTKSEYPVLSLNHNFEELCIAYEICRQIQFPELLKEENDPGAQSFFLNTEGNPYIRKKGGVDSWHMIPWMNATGRKNSPSIFRDAVSNFAIMTDLKTRINLAFHNNHSASTMVENYAKTSDKNLEGLKAIQKYRENRLRIAAEIHSQSGRKLTIRGSTAHISQAKALQKKHEIDIRKAIEKEDKLFQDDSDRNHTGTANNESRASLIKLCSQEIKTTRPVNTYYLADYLLRRGEDKLQTQRMMYRDYTEAILSLVDSPRFKESLPAMSLTRLMIRASQFYHDKGVQEEDDDVRMGNVEDKCCKEWRTQLSRITSASVSDKGLIGISHALADIKIASGKDYYNLGNIHIKTVVANVIKTRDSHRDAVLKAERDMEDDVDDPDKVSPETAFRNMMGQRGRDQDQKESGVSRRLDFDKR